MVRAFNESFQPTAYAWAEFHVRYKATDKMNNWLHIITAVIATVATVFMAIFAWVLLKINRRQHQLDYEQELILHSCEPTLSIVGDVEPDKTGKLIHKSKPTSCMCSCQFFCAPSCYKEDRCKIHK